MMQDRFSPLRTIAMSAAVLLIVIFLGKVTPTIVQGMQPPTPEPTATPTATVTPIPTPTPAVDAERALESIYREQVSTLSETAQQKLVDEYRALKERAKREGIRMPSSCTVAARASDVGKFFLEKATWEDCYLDKDKEKKGKGGEDDD